MAQEHIMPGQIAPVGLDIDLKPPIGLLFYKKSPHRGLERRNIMYFFKSDAATQPCNVFIQGQNNQFDIEVPNFCEFEKISTNFSLKGALMAEQIKDNFHFPAVFICPSCHHFIVMDYACSLRVTRADLMPYNYYFATKNFPFSDVIADLSSRFKNIYEQTSISETMGLNELTGFGYRKALEFLIKDYLIKTLNKDSESIKKKRLGECINLLPDDDLKNTSKITSWIGNDSTHYALENPDLNLKDLKNYLNVTAQFIAFKVEAKKAGMYVKDHQKNS